MTTALRRTIPVLMATLALAHAGCSSKSPERTLTGPQATASGEEGRLSAMGVRAPYLGTAAAYAVLGGTTVTCTGATAITGLVGVSPGTAATGFPVPCPGVPVFPPLSDP